MYELLKKGGTATLPQLEVPVKDSESVVWRDQWMNWIATNLGSFLQLAWSAEPTSASDSETPSTEAHACCAVFSAAVAAEVESRRRDLITLTVKSLDSLGEDVGEWESLRLSVFIDLYNFLPERKEKIILLREILRTALKSPTSCSLDGLTEQIRRVEPILESAIDEENRDVLEAIAALYDYSGRSDDSLSMRIEYLLRTPKETKSCTERDMKVLFQSAVLALQRCVASAFLPILKCPIANGALEERLSSLVSLLRIHEKGSLPDFDAFCRSHSEEAFFVPVDLDVDLCRRHVQGLALAKFSLSHQSASLEEVERALGLSSVEELEDVLIQTVGRLQLFEAKIDEKTSTVRFWTTLVNSDSAKESAVEYPPEQWAELLTLLKDSREKMERHLEIWAKEAPKP